MTSDDALLVKTKSFARPNVLKQTMEAGGLGFSFGITMAHSIEVVHLAAVMGYTALLLNMEHQRADIGVASDLCCTALNLGITPICVVPACESTWVSRLLDNGAQGIICPRVGDVATAQKLVEFSKYRPIGKRPLIMLPQMQYQLPSVKHTMDVINETTLTIPMIETVEGLDNCEAIARVPGVDMLFVGVFDLSDELGIAGQYDNPKLWTALSRICNAASAANIKVGFGGLESRPDMIAKLRHENQNVGYVMAGRDLSVLQGGMEAMVNGMKAIQ